MADYADYQHPIDLAEALLTELSTEAAGGTFEQKLQLASVAAHVESAKRLRGIEQSLDDRIEAVLAKLQETLRDIWDRMPA